MTEEHHDTDAAASQEINPGELLMRFMQTVIQNQELLDRRLAMIMDHLGIQEQQPVELRPEDIEYAFERVETVDAEQMAASVRVALTDEEGSFAEDGTYTGYQVFAPADNGSGDWQLVEHFANQHMSRALFEQIRQDVDHAVDGVLYYLVSYRPRQDQPAAEAPLPEADDQT